MTKIIDLGQNLVCSPLGLALKVNGQSSLSSLRNIGQLQHTQTMKHFGIYCLRRSETGVHESGFRGDNGKKRLGRRLSPHISSESKTDGCWASNEITKYRSKNSSSLTFAYRHLPSNYSRKGYTELWPSSVDKPRCFSIWMTSSRG